jgi:hypothetical protein
MSSPKAIAQAGNWRVFKIDESLRSAMKSAREKEGQTVAEFLESSLDNHLPQLIESLQALGVQKSGKSRPARLPMTRGNLNLLKKSAIATGLDQSQLLLACLRLASKAQPAKRGRKAGAK